MNLAVLLEKTAQRVPDHVALRFENRQLSYGELNRRVNKVAGAIKNLGIGPGDRCILMMQTCPEFVVAYYALAKIGAVIIPVNFLYKAHELRYIISDSQPRAFIGMYPYLDEPARVLADFPECAVRIALGVQSDADFISFESLDAPELLETYPASDEDTLAILYTSGTTGAPKGAMLTHKNLYSNAMTVADMRHTEPGDVVIGVLPLYHVFGQTSVMNASIYLGLTLHLFSHFDPGAVLELIEKEKSTLLFAVPTMINRLIAEAEARGLKRSSLRFCISGGASLPVELLKKFEKIFQTKIYEGYGLTECSPVCIENPFGGKTKPGSIGLPIPGFQIRIVDDSGRDVKTGEVGELLVKGPGVMKGYLNKPEETAKTIVDGWLHTGDMARQDEEGYVYIVDRKKDMIIRGGYNVYPREIEEILYRHPDVLEAAVYGVPDADLGEEVAADVVVRDGARVTEEELRKFVKDLVAPYKYPRHIRLVRELPKSHTGKVLKKELRERWVSR
ncbi:long-chain-fatty-acid--CoA ligase [Thermodesulforhabdus norvegica]|uniref:Long-chain acyl-CoA synthetase n=1 Tax=Thermodesulforhabdus norvegica TaxID=39841 RepID=A0A1I4W8T9_9BACT|nr:long-chain fatty acid--CoA ligase [Thermodesulforhabdus norvegica]SFN10164.1 long-chain acyl-CoA synthetase [Thermodesulforhabdus norvegica]